MKRRQFVGTVAAAAMAAPSSSPAAPNDKTISIQFGAVSLIDEGVERVLDNFQERGAINALMPAVFSFSNGTAGRQLPGIAFPDHGKHEQEELRGGNFARVHPQYYKDTAVDAKLTQAPDHPKFDVLGDLIPTARKRGMKVFGLVQDHFPESFPNVEKLQERDFNGQRAETLCKNNPYYRNFLLGLVEDFTRSYDIDGLMFVVEHQGAFSDILGSRLRGKKRGQPGSRTCFCDYCREKGIKQGINFNRVVTAFNELEKLVVAGRARKRPVDGYYVTLWRLMLKYPELLMWEHFFHENVRETLRLMHRRMKAVRQNAMFGIHVWHNFTMSPLYRAEQDMAELAGCCDFLKPALYHRCGAPRLASYIESVAETMYGDVPPDELLQFHYRVLDLKEAPYDRVRQAPLSGDYVYRETRRTLAGLNGAKTPVYVGIDVDIPVRPEDVAGQSIAAYQKATRASVRDAAAQALRAGAQGLVVCRKYSEMYLDSLSGIGDAVRGMA